MPLIVMTIYDIMCLLIVFHRLLAESNDQSQIWQLIYIPFSLFPISCNGVDTVFY